MQEKSKKIIIGIDPSMRSTGMCIWDGNKHKYYLIAASPTKKLQNFSHPALRVVAYTPTPVKDRTSIGKEWAKTDNVETVVSAVRDILLIYKPEYVVVEAVAYGASGRIDELAGLNYAIRLVARGLDIPVYAVTPTSNKMHFSGNGQATKDIMVESWKACDPVAHELCNIGKGPDDLADAYALCHYPEQELKNR